MSESLKLINLTGWYPWCDKNNNSTKYYKKNCFQKMIYHFMFQVQIRLSTTDTKGKTVLPTSIICIQELKVINALALHVYQLDWRKGRGSMVQRLLLTIGDLPRLDRILFNLLKARSNHYLMSVTNGEEESESTGESTSEANFDNSVDFSCFCFWLFYHCSIMLCFCSLMSFIVVALWLSNFANNQHLTSCFLSLDTTSLVFQLSVCILRHAKSWALMFIFYLW